MHFAVIKILDQFKMRKILLALALLTALSVSVADVGNPKNLEEIEPGVFVSK